MFSFIFKIIKSTLSLIFFDEITWILLQRKIQQEADQKVINDIIANIEREIFYAKVTEYERSIFEVNNYRIIDFVDKYYLIPKQIRTDILNIIYKKYDQDKDKDENMIGFYQLSMILVNVLFVYEGYFDEDKEIELYKNIVKFTKVKRSRIFNYLIYCMFNIFKESYVKILPRDLKYFHVISQIKNDVAYRPLMVKYYETKERFENRIKSNN